MTGSTFVNTKHLYEVSVRVEYMKYEYYLSM